MISVIKAYSTCPGILTCSYTGSNFGCINSAMYNRRYSLLTESKLQVLS